MYMISVGERDALTQEVARMKAEMSATDWMLPVRGVNKRIRMLVDEMVMTRDVLVSNPG